MTQGVGPEFNPQCDTKKKKKEEVGKKYERKMCYIF
jgi:hypothetical protein